MSQMPPSTSEARLPDVSIPEAEKVWGVKLPWVGMREIEMPIRLMMPEGLPLVLSARIDFGMNLQRQDARGIHMSRLYRILSDRCPTNPLSFEVLSLMASEALKSHEDLSDETKLTIRFALPLERKALRSEGKGWRTYPVTVGVHAKRGESVSLTTGVEVLYSSTCPASAALSRQMHQQAALKHFQADTLTRIELEEYFNAPQSMAATPHAQRSLAKVNVEWPLDILGADLFGGITRLIDLLENALGTPVQTLVKREDEQEFAVRNAENLLFCEDAARRLAGALEASGDYAAWSGEVSHLESLHPHNAVAEFSGISSSKGALSQKSLQF